VWFRSVVGVKEEAGVGGDCVALSRCAYRAGIYGRKCFCLRRVSKIAFEEKVWSSFR
jgi:hypothetical protein